MAADFRKELTEKIIASLEAGTAPWQKPWDGLVVQQMMPFNPVSGVHYRGGNQLALMLSPYQDPRWCTYKQAEANGWQVRKGQRSTLIEFWKWDKEIERLNEETQQMEKVRVRMERPIVRYANVFNLQQMDNVPKLERSAGGYEWEPAEMAERILANTDVRFFYDQADSAFYHPALDQVHLPPREAFATPAKFYATALHELGHATGHADRMARDLSGNFGSMDYAKEELRAELASFFLSARLGIEFDLGNHASYVNSWVKVLREDKNEIFKASRDAEAITEYVMGYGRDQERQAEKASLSTAQIRLHEIVKGKMRAEAIQSFSHEEMVRVFGNVVHPDRALRAVRELVANGLTIETLYAESYGHKSVNEAMSKLGVNLAQKQENLSQKFPTSEIIATETNQKTYINVKYAEKEEAKRLGAKWDKKRKSWYVPGGIDVALFSKWNVAGVATPLNAFEADFAEALASAGLVIEGAPIMDGKWHHTKVNTSRSAKALKGAYKANIINGVADGFIKNHDTGEARPWVPEQLNVSIQDIEAFRRKQELNRQEREAETQREQESVAAKCAKKWASFETVTSHPYLDRKGVDGFGLRVDGDRLVTPVRDADGRIWSLQYISSDPEKTKMYEKGGQKTGHFHVLGDLSGTGPVLFAEGYATAASLHMATNLPVIETFDSGNLDAAMKSLATTLHGRPKLVCGDDDTLDVHRVARTLLQTVWLEINAKLDIGGIYEADIRLNAGPVQTIANPDCFLTLETTEVVPGVMRVKGKIRNEKNNFEVPVTIANVGREKAVEAAKANGAEVIFPVFELGQAGHSDFNDLHASSSLDEVKRQIVPALERAILRASPEAFAKAHFGENVVLTEPKDKQSYVGQVVVNTTAHTLQDIGKRTAVKHELGRLNRVPAVGSSAKIIYRNGKGTVQDMTRTAIEKSR